MPLHFLSPLSEDGILDTVASLRTALGAGTTAAFALVALVLYAMSLQNFLLFHGLAEIFAIVVAFAAFALAWYSRAWIGGGGLLILGIGQLFVGGIDVLHVLAYKGMGVFDTRGGANLSTQLWLAARTVDAVVVLAALSGARRSVSPVLLFLLLGILSFFLVGAAFAGWWPVTFVEGVGLTPFKVAAEVALILAFLAGIGLIRRQSGCLDPEMCALLMVALAAKAVTEMAFTFYVDVYGLANTIGHLMKIVGSWMLFRAIVETGLKRPQSLVFGARERERRLAEEVSRHASTLDAVLGATLDPVAMVDEDGRLRFVSRAAEAFLGRGSALLEGKLWSDTGMDEGLARPLDILCRQVLADGIPQTREISLLTSNLCYEVQVAPIPGGKAVVAIIRDTSARKAMEEELKASLEENRVLMMEVHHRVKNNLQIVSSILQMQGWRMPDPVLRGQFEDACGRILSLAKVHEMLYKQESAAAVDFGRYVRTLCDELAHMYNVREDWVRIEVAAEDLSIALDKAVPLALILHELVTNALKHAFDERGGRLGIRVTSPELLQGCLEVRDDGKGGTLSPADFSGDAASLGLRMVGVLVKQIHGKLDIDGSEGTAVTIRFPL